MNGFQLQQHSFLAEILKEARKSISRDAKECVPKEESKDRTQREFLFLRFPCLLRGCDLACRALLPRPDPPRRDEKAHASRGLSRAAPQGCVTAKPRVHLQCDSQGHERSGPQLRIQHLREQSYFRPTNTQLERCARARPAAPAAALRCCSPAPLTAVPPERPRGQRWLCAGTQSTGSRNKAPSAQRNTDCKTG